MQVTLLTLSVKKPGCLQCCLVIHLEGLLFSITLQIYNTENYQVSLTIVGVINLSGMISLRTVVLHKESILCKKIIIIILFQVFTNK